MKLFELWTHDRAVDYQDLRGTMLSNTIVNRIAKYFGDEVDKFLGGRANG